MIKKLFLISLFLLLPVSSWGAFAQLVTKTNTGDAETTSHSVTLPASLVAGNQLYMLLTCRNAATVITTPDGWTRDLTVNTNVSLGFFRKVSTGGEGASVAVTTDLSVACSWQVEQWAGVHGSTAPEHSTVATGTSSTAPNSTGVTPSWGAEDTVWLTWFGVTANPTISAYPSNYTGNNTYAVSSGTSNTVTGSATRELNTTTQDPGAFTISASNNWAAFTTAIRPAGPAGSFRRRH